MLPGFRAEGQRSAVRYFYRHLMRTAKKFPVPELQKYCMYEIRNKFRTPLEVQQAEWSSQMASGGDHDAEQAESLYDTDAPMQWVMQRYLESMDFLEKALVIDCPERRYLLDLSFGMQPQADLEDYDLSKPFCPPRKTVTTTSSQPSSTTSQGQHEQSRPTPHSPHVDVTAGSRTDTPDASASESGAKPSPLRSTASTGDDVDDVFESMKGLLSGKSDNGDSASASALSTTPRSVPKRRRMRTKDPSLEEVLGDEEMAFVSHMREQMVQRAAATENFEAWDAKTNLTDYFPAEGVEMPRMETKQSESDDVGLRITERDRSRKAWQCTFRSLEEEESAMRALKPVVRFSTHTPFKLSEDA